MPEPEPEELGFESQDSGYGHVYLSWCRAVNNRFPSSPKKLEKIEIKRKERFKKVEERYQKALLNLKEIEQNYDDTHKIYRSSSAKLKQAEKALARAERIYKQEKFNKAITLLGLDITLQETMTLAGFFALLIFLSGISILVFALLIFNTGIIEVAMYLVPGILFAPLLVFALIASYPEILANRVKTKSLGRSPEAVNYLVMSMRLSPSLSKAVAFAADSADEPIASGLKKVLWNIYMREYDSVEDSFLAFAYEWGEINEDFKRSLYAIRSSTLERSDEGRIRILEKAQEIVLEGTKRKVEDFASSLQAPTTVLFALGILLPMIIGAMLPLMSLSVPSGASLGTTANPTSDNSPDIGGALTIVLLMDVVFPLVAFFYAYHILGKRPGTATPPDVKSELSVHDKRTLALISATLILGFGVLGIPFLRRYLGDFGTLLGPVWVLLGIGFALGFYFRATSKYQKQRRDEIKKMEGEFPDALFKLGSRIAEGEPLETALGKVADSMKGSVCAELFEKIAYTISVTRSTPEDAMFGEDLGVLNDLPSRTIRATMKTVIESTKKDAQNAGSIIINISNYLRDMKKVEHDIKTSLNQTVSMMKSTGLLFAPLVMGITASLYVLLSKEFANLPGSTQMLSNDLFFMVIGVYLILMVMVTVYFSVGIEHGEDRIELRYSLGNAVPLAIIVYAFSLVAGQFLIS
jgi:Flp pilus assembly protein TadB